MLGRRGVVPGMTACGLWASYIMPLGLHSLVQEMGQCQLPRVVCAQRRYTQGLILRIVEKE